MDKWREYKDAPQYGDILCNTDQVPKKAALKLEFGAFSALLFRSGKGYKAYVNLCPHQYLPLDYRGDQLLSKDRKSILCTNHAASFSVETGQGRDGFCEGMQLAAIPIAVTSNGEIIVSDI
ncbi:MAG: Rieske (2Fe-2S) protein [bacterium]